MLGLFFRTRSTVFLVQVSQEAQGWKGLPGEPKIWPEGVHVVWKMQATSFFSCEILAEVLFAVTSTEVSEDSLCLI